MPHRTLIACLGNIFLGDDGFGVEVARRLAGEELPAGARLTDYGIRGMHLAYDLAEGWDTTILVDTADRGGEPGTVYVIKPERAQAAGAGDGLVNSMLFDPHGMQPDMMLGMAGTLGAEAGEVLVVGCQPACLDEGMGLSPSVAAAVDEAAHVVLSLARDASHGPASDHDPPGERTGPVPADDQNQPDSTPEGSDQITAKGGSHVPWHTG
jgi:hydrogenase maturation protease